MGTCSYPLGRWKAVRQDKDALGTYDWQHGSRGQCCRTLYASNTTPPAEAAPRDLAAGGVKARSLALVHGCLAGFSRGGAMYKCHASTPGESAKASGQLSMHSRHSRAAGPPASGNHTPMNLPAKSRPMLPCHTARHTSQLPRIPAGGPVGSAV